jgi:hypothetical protein
VEFNIGINVFSSDVIINVALCRQRVEYRDNEVVDEWTSEGVESQQQRVANMAECLLLENHLNDKLELHLRSASYNNKLISALVREDVMDELTSGNGNGSGSGSGSGNGSGSGSGNDQHLKPVGLLISTLGRGQYNMSDEGQGHGDDYVDELRSSLFSYFLSFSNHVYILVPDSSVCETLSAISITCCSLDAAGKIHLIVHVHVHTYMINSL